MALAHNRIGQVRIGIEDVEFGVTSDQPVKARSQPFAREGDACADGQALGILLSTDMFGFSGQLRQ